MVDDGGSPLKKAKICSYDELVEETYRAMTRAYRAIQNTDVQIPSPVTEPVYPDRAYYSIAERYIWASDPSTVELSEDHFIEGFEKFVAAKVRNEEERDYQKQCKQRALIECTEMTITMKMIENELSTIGSTNLKNQLRKWVKSIVLDHHRRFFGLQIGINGPPHMAFVGNPGTGKKWVAGVLGKIFHMAGIIPTNKVTVMKLDSVSLVGRLRDVEGILFLTMADCGKDDSSFKPLGDIITAMKTGRVSVIFGGSSSEIEHLLCHEGLATKLNKKFFFSDFSSEELASILQATIEMQKEGDRMYGFKIDSQCSLRTLANLIEEGTTEDLRKEFNGHMVEILLMNARENLDTRLDINCMNEADLCTIMLEDLEAGIQQFSDSELKSKSHD